MVTYPRVHDLVKLSPIAITTLVERAVSSGDLWVHSSLDSAPWAVVRRALPAADDHVAIGIRGLDRSQRWGTDIPLSEIEEVISVDELVERNSGTLPHGPAFEALNTFIGLPFQIGPGGSAGFELHTGWKVTHDRSDLDMVVYFNHPPTPEEIALLKKTAEQAAAHTRVDILVETPSGGVAFEELARASGMVPQPSMMLRTSEGPELVTEIWR